MGLQYRVKMIPPVEKAKPVEPLAAPAVRKRGPKPSGKAKQLITLRLDRDVIENFRATGPGWQARMNDVLKAAKP